MISPTKLRELKAKAEGATPGPWISQDGWVISQDHSGEHFTCRIPLELGSMLVRYDTQFICAFSPDVCLELLAEVKRLQTNSDLQEAHVLKLQQLILLTDPSVSDVEMNSVAGRQWIEYRRWDRARQEALAPQEEEA